MKSFTIKTQDEVDRFMGLIEITNLNEMEKFRVPCMRFDKLKWKHQSRKNGVNDSPRHICIEDSRDNEKIMITRREYELLVNTYRSYKPSDQSLSKKQEDEMVEEILEFLDGDTDSNLSETTIN